MFATLQRIGRSLMLPIAVLPAAGILLRFGQPDLLNIPWLADAGGAIFGNLALLFAIGVAVGFTADIGTAGIAGAVGYWVFTKVLVDISGSVYGEAGAKVDMGVLAGILMGLVLPFAWGKYLETGELGAAFQFAELWEMLKNNMGPAFIVLLVSWLALFVAELVGIILCGVGILFTMFYAQLVMAFLYGALYRQAKATPVLAE